MKEDTPSLVPIAYESQNYKTGRAPIAYESQNHKTGRVLGDCAGKTFLTNEELSNELYVVVLCLKLFRDEVVMAFHICTYGWSPSHSQGLPEKHPFGPGVCKPSS